MLVGRVFHGPLRLEVWQWRGLSWEVLWYGDMAWRRVSTYAVALDGQAEKANRELDGTVVALRGARARTRSTEDRVDMVMEMGKESTAWTLEIHLSLEVDYSYTRTTSGPV
jgi:hypothetical protein